MAGTTQVNYDEMQTIIKSLQSEEEEIMQLMKQTQGKVESLHNNQWIGQGADKFFDEMEQTVLPAMNRLGHALGVGARVAQQILNTIHHADEETKSYFGNLG
jgi:WXG100 family type VII secretion target